MTGRGGFISIEVTPERFSFKTIDIGGQVIDRRLGSASHGPWR